MAYIIPAILEETIDGFNDKVFRLERVLGVERIQVDFCDGIFVPSRTITVNEFDALNPAFAWEAHVMASEPRQFLDYKIAGFDRVIVHIEAFSAVSDVHLALDAITGLGLTPALAINPDSDPGRILEFAKRIRHVTVLCVDPGRQGAPFRNESLEVLKFLRKAMPDAILEADGSINLATIGQVHAAGADAVAVGSALFATGDVRENYDALMTMSLSSDMAGGGA